MIRDSGIHPSESLFIDDGIRNIHAAKDLGFHTLQVENGKDWRASLTALLHDYK
jgi:putative hydrolase of the HAD superfamily